MKNLTDEEKKNFLEWSEGNEYLYKLLCACWENEIKTFASCGGHDKGNDNPYLGVIIDDNSLPFIKSILGQIQDMPNITITSDVRHSGNGQLFADKELRALVFYAHNYNCCEMFYKMRKGIETKENEINFTQKADRFYGSIKKLSVTSREELQDDVNNNIVVGSTFSTKTQEFIDYENSKKLTDNNKFIRFFRKLFSLKKIDVGKYEKLQRKYGFLQREYEENNVKRSVGLEHYKVENIDNRMKIQQHIVNKGKKEKENIEDNER